MKVYCVVYKDTLVSVYIFRREEDAKETAEEMNRLRKFNLFKVIEKEI